MPISAEWYEDHLQSVRLGLGGFALRIARLEKKSSVAPGEGRLPFEQLVDVVTALTHEREQIHTRLTDLEGAHSPARTQPVRADGDPMDLLFKALESINEELTGFAARLARLEEDEGRVEFDPAIPLPAIRRRTPDGVVCAVRCRRAGKAAPRA